MAYKVHVYGGNVVNIENTYSQFLSIYSCLAETWGICQYCTWIVHPSCLKSSPRVHCWRNQPTEEWR